MTTIPTPVKFREILEYRKRTVSINSTPDGSKVSTTSMWDGGSRTYYSAFNYRTGQLESCPPGAWPATRGEYTMKPGEVILSTGVFAGKIATGRIIFQKSEARAVCDYFGINHSLVTETQEEPKPLDTRIEIPAHPHLRFVDPPDTCDLYAFNPAEHEGDGRIVNEFSDASLPGSGWANVCPTCAVKHGVRYGAGFGQRYQRAKDDNFYKVQG